MESDTMLKAGLNVLIDGQWGSTGKGKIAGWLGAHHDLDLVCSSFGPNAGHTYVDDGGKEFMFKIMPSSACTTDCPVLLSPDSVFKEEQFWKEVAILRGENVHRAIYVHPLAMVLRDGDRVAAEVTGRHVSGTMQGTGHAISRKLLRLPGTLTARDVLPGDIVRDTCEMMRECCDKQGRILYEISQGFDLSLNHGHTYPYVTSRDITVAQCLNGAGVPTRDLGTVIGSIRTFPIRVGNVDEFTSGPGYPDQCEVTWGHVASEGGGPKDLCELTTVTKRVRRVFTFSIMQLRKFVAVNDPDHLFLNFAQYLDWKGEGARNYNELSDTIKQFVAAVESESGVGVPLIGTGAKLSDMVVM
jgi:adenylosuccinate synthase